MPVTVRRINLLSCLPMLVGALCIATGVSAAGDLSGIWQGQFLESQVLPENPGFTPAGRQAQREFDPANDPYLRCIVYMPRAMLAWQPTRIEIIQSETRVWILFEAYHQVRRIFLDGTPPFEAEGRLWLGHSNGRWEGDSLVVETNHLRENISFHWEGLPLSGEARITERFTRLNDETLEVLMTVIDPVYYERPWETRHLFRLDPDAHFFEYECDNPPADGVAATD